MWKGYLPNGQDEKGQNDRIVHVTGGDAAGVFAGNVPGRRVTRSNTTSGSKNNTATSPG